MLLFLGAPAIYCIVSKDNPRDVLKLPAKKMPGLLMMGAAVYIVIMLVYFAARSNFDFSEIVSNLSSDQNVTKNSFFPVALYISFGNSLVEEVLDELF